MELRCEVNSGNETLYGEFNSRIDGSFNQADHAGVTGLGLGLDEALRDRPFVRVEFYLELLDHLEVRVAKARLRS